MTSPISLLSISRDSSAALSTSQGSSYSPTHDSLLTSQSSPDIAEHYPLVKRSKSNKRGTIPSNFFNSVQAGEGLPSIETTEPSSTPSPRKVRKISTPRKLVLELPVSCGQSSENPESPSQRERKISSPRSKFKHLAHGEEKLESPRLSPTEATPVRGRKISKKKSAAALKIDEEGASRSPSPRIEKPEETKGLLPRSELESRSPRRNRNTCELELTKTATMRKRDLYKLQHCSQRSAVEVNSKRSDLSNSKKIYLSEFGDTGLKKLRDASIASSVDSHTLKQIKVKQFKSLNTHKNKKIKETFLKKMREKEQQALDFANENLQEIVDRILRKEINGVIQKQFVPQSTKIKEGKYDLAKIVQYTLLLETNFFKRLNQCHELVLNHAIQKKQTTPFLNSLHFFLNKLTTLKSIEDKKYLLDWGVSIPDFLAALELMENTTTSDDVKNVINSAIGPCKDSILAFLANWNFENSELPFMPPPLETKIDEITDKYIKLRKATGYEHIWEEPVDHKHENPVYPPFDQISLKDIINYYFREEAIEIPIYINGHSILDNPFTEEELRINRVKYFFNFFSKLLEALGYKARKIKNAAEPSLQEELETLLKYITNPAPIHASGESFTFEETRSLEEKIFSPEIRECFGLLKLGGIESWGRAEYYINQRYGLFDKVVEVKTFANKKEPTNYFIEIHKSKNHCLDFQINKNPADSFVEQKKSVAFNVQYKRNDVKAEMLVSWKVHLPLNNSFRCIFRPLEISINNHGGNQMIEEIENHLINFNKDEIIQEKLVVGNIKIYSLFNKLLNTKGVTLFT